MPIEEKTMLVLLSDGKWLHEFAKMLRADKKCHSFTVENTHMFCGGHPDWDPKEIGLIESLIISSFLSESLFVSYQFFLSKIAFYLHK